MKLKDLLARTSPRPWSINPWGGSYEILDEPKKHLISEDTRYEEARLIAHCVNNFERMVKKLELIRDEAYGDKKWAKVVDLSTQALNAAEEVK